MNELDNLSRKEKIELYEKAKRKENKMAKIFYLFIFLLIVFGVYSFYLDKHIVYFLNDEAIIDVGNTYQIELIPKYSKYFNYEDYILSVDDTSIAKIDEYGQITGLKNGNTKVKLRFKNGYETKKLNVIVDNVKVESIQIDDNISIFVNETKKLVYKINNIKNVNTNLKFKISNEKILKVDDMGNITGLKEGTCSLTIESDNGIKKTIQVDVKTSNDKIEEVRFKKNQIDLYVGDNKQLDLEVFPSKANTKGLKWSSSDDSIVSVNKNGIITAKKEGYAIITVKNNDKIEAKCIINVTKLIGLVLNKYNETLTEGENTVLSANVDVNWFSSNEKIAIVDKNGKVTAKKEGKVKIIAKDLFGNTKECNITIKRKIIDIENILLNKTYLELTKGDVEKLNVEFLPSTVNNANVSWKSDNSSIASVDSSGKVTANKEGITLISVRSDNGKVATCEVKVTSELSNITLDKETVTLEKNKKIKLNVLGTKSKDLTWKSSDEKIAKVDSDGVVSTIDYGTAIINVITSNGLESSCIIYVKEEKILVKSIKINNSKERLYIGDNYSLKVTINPNNATNQSITFISSDNNVASIDKNGRIVAKKEGTVTITAKSSNGKISSFKLTIISVPVTQIIINKAEETISIGKSFNISTKILPSNATDQSLTYISNNNNVVTVDKNGKVTGIKPGKATIMVKSNNGVTATCNVIVSDILPQSISFKSLSLKLVEGESKSLDYSIKPDNATNKKLIWNSSNESIVTVNNGIVTAKKSGKSVITAYSEINKNVKSEMLIEVTKREIDIESISLNKTEIETYEGNKVSLSVIVIPSNATNKTISYTSSDSNIASVNNKGEVTAKKVGKAIITAKSSNGKIAKCNITVKKSTIDVESIKIDSNISVINIGEEAILSYSIKPDNATNKNVIWNSNDTSIATVDNNGKVKGLKEGNVKISVYSVNNPSSIDYKDIVIRKKDVLVTKLKLSENNIVLNMNQTYKLDITISPNNATNKKITWTSSNQNVAIVNSSGEVKAIKYGVSKITARSENGKTVSCNVIVLNKNISVSYNSDTLKYWFENPDSNYGITRVWVKDAYNQMKINAGITMTSNVGPDFSWEEINRINEINACFNDPNRNYVMYKNLRAHEHYNDIIEKNNASTKGLVAFNASGVISTYWGTGAPCSWHGTPPIPLFINDGKVLRDSSDGTYNITKEIRGLNKNGDLVYYKMNSGKTDAQKQKNKELAQKIIDSGIKYTFDFRPVLVENFKAKDNLSEENNIRQAICQIDKNNFVVITSTVGNTSSYSRTYLGLNYKKLAEIFVDYGCKIAFNLDGGGSTVIYFKNNNYANPYKYGPYDGRMLTDMMYFIEK